MIIPIFFFGACSDDSNEEAVEMEYEYFPLDSGRYFVYDVDSVIYRKDGSLIVVDSFQYQVKEVIAGEFYDNEGRLSHILEVYKRIDSNQIWSLTNLRSLTLSDYRIIKQEAQFTNNETQLINRIKFVFPPQRGKEWDANALASEEELTYKITDKGIQQTINNKTYNNCVVVLQKDLSVAIEIKYAYEVYAKNTGMIYSEDLDTKIDSYGNYYEGYFRKNILIESGI